MTHLVAYIEYGPAPVVLELKKVLGADFDPGPLPFASVHIASDADRQERTDTVEALLDQCSPGAAILVRRGQSQPLRVEEARECLKESEEWRSFLDEFEISEEDATIEERELEECWAVFAYMHEGGIPPGVVFLVDKVEGNVFARRYADLYYLFRELD